MTDDANGFTGLGRSPAEAMLAAFRSRRRSSLPASEVASVALLLVVVFYVVGAVLAFDSGPLLTRGWSEILRLTYWAGDPWLAAVLVVSCLLALDQITSARDDIEALGDGTEDSVENRSRDAHRRIDKLWDHAGHAHVIAVLVGPCGVLFAVSAVGLVVFEFHTPFPSTTSHLSAVLDGLSDIAGATAVVFVSARVQGVWSQLGVLEGMLGEETGQT